MLTAKPYLWSLGSEAKNAVNIVCLNKWGRLEGLVKDDEVPPAPYRTASCLHIASHCISTHTFSSVKDVNKEMSIRRLAQSILERGKREMKRQSEKEKVHLRQRKTGSISGETKSL